MKNKLKKISVAYRGLRPLRCHLPNTINESIRIHGFQTTDNICSKHTCEMLYLHSGNNIPSSGCIRLYGSG